MIWSAGFKPASCPYPGFLSQGSLYRMRAGCPRSDYFRALLISTAAPMKNTAGASQPAI